MITNLVFQGGSVKGIAYIGALESIDMSNIKRVAGASAGAITAGLLAMSFSLDEVKDLLSEFDFKRVLDDKEGGFNTRDKVLKAVDHFSEDSSIKGIKSVKPVKKVIAYRLFDQSGLYEGEYLRQWAETKIQEQILRKTDGRENGVNLTFAELHQLTEKYPDAGFRDLKVVGSNFTKKEKKVFCYEDDDTKNVIISDAIRISMSIPLLFKPHNMYIKDANGERKRFNKDTWEDGGVYDNYPIDCFDEQRYMEEGEEMCQADNGKRYNQNTLGFRLVSPEDKKYYEDLRDTGKGIKPSKESNSLKAVGLGFFGANFALQNEKYSSPEHLKRTIYINHLNTSLFAFNLSNEKKEDLIKSGKDAFLSFYLNPENGLDIPLLPTP